MPNDDSPPELPKDLEIEMWVRMHPRFISSTTSMRGISYNLITLKNVDEFRLSVFVRGDTAEEAWRAAMLLLMKDRLKQ